MTSHYVGRFAPSPTGALHFGSLYAALASFLDAKANNGLWLVRIEDIDTPRTVQGASDEILNALHQHGMIPDEPVLHQSQNLAHYQEILNRLITQNHCFYCQCSRAKLSGFTGYPGHCRQQTTPSPDTAIRIKANNNDFESFVDRLQGLQKPSPLDNGLHNDFILKRRDGFFSYQFACVIDDINQSVTDIVRGIDIMDSTFKQRFLYKTLNKPSPSYLHLPIITNRQGQKLSKQNLAQAINNDKAPETLLLALKALQQKLPPTDTHSSVRKILAFAIKHWTPQHILNKKQIAEQELI